ncbi:hypothetical protein MBLNU459_g6903t1 [Dothideomycetes sp. NU459]
MPSQRRIKVFGLLLVLAILTLVYMSSSARSTRSSEFYTRTVAALDTKHRAAQEALDLDNHKKIQDAHEAALAEKAAKGRNPDSPVPAAAPPKEQKPFAVDAEHAAGQAKKVAESVKEDVKDSVHGLVDGDKSVAGRKMMKGEKGLKDDGVAKVGNTGAKPTPEAESTSETDEEHAIEVELNSILKKSPIIIFSKSYCPYSKKAKDIILSMYNIVPAPYVEELDQHPLGPGLQAALQKSTGRRTVPNVLINGKSIGGGDDVANLHAEDKLIDMIKSMGGKRIMEVSKKAAEKVEGKGAMRFRS